MIAALDNPRVDILGHPFGMTLNRFGFEPEENLFDELISQCRKKNKIFEVNYRYHKNPKILIDKCIKNKTKLSLGSNAHSKEEEGIQQSRQFRQHASVERRVDRHHQHYVTKHRRYIEKR